MSKSLSDYQPSDILFRRVNQLDQSFLEIRKAELLAIKENILRSVVDLQAEFYHDEAEIVERQDIIDKKMTTISLLEVKIHEMELECHRISNERRLAAEAVETERKKLRQEVDDLLEYRRKSDERRLIRELVYELAVPSEMMNFKTIEDFLDRHQREIERLERMKIGTTPSQIELINNQIAESELKFNEELNGINFQCDEDGRKFYYDSNGDKKYLNEFRILMDELGDYCIDLNGNKSYLRKYAFDANGRYYLDEDDNRIYKATPYAPECRLVNGVLIRIREKLDTISVHSREDKRQEDEVDSIAAESANLNFLMKHYAKPLKMALVDMVWKQPVDPIDHFQKFLRNYEEKNQQRSTEDAFFAKLEQKRKIVARHIFEEN